MSRTESFRLDYSVRLSSDVINMDNLMLTGFEGEGDTHLGIFSCRFGRYEYGRPFREFKFFGGEIHARLLPDNFLYPERERGHLSIYALTVEGVINQVALAKGKIDGVRDCSESSIDDDLIEFDLLAVPEDME